MLIDAHVHLYPEEVLAERARYIADDAWFRVLYEPANRRLSSPDELLASMTETGIEQSVVASFPWASQDLCEAHNRCFGRLVDPRLSRLCMVQPRAGARAADELRRCLDAGFVGLGEINVDALDAPLDQAELWGPLVEILAEAGGTLMIHASEPVGHQYRGKGVTTPEKIYRFAMAYPQLKIVAAHWGGGLPFYYLMPEMGPALPNLYFDSAATEYLYDKRVFDTCARFAGSDRVLFGSDFPLLTQERALEHARSAGLPADAPFFGANAAAVYKRP